VQTPFIIKVKKKDILELLLFWKCLRSTTKDINIILDIADKKDKLIMRKFLPICYRVFPTNSWQEGQVFADRLRLKIPHSLSNERYNLKIAFLDYRNGSLCKINGDTDELGRACLTEVK